MATKNLLELIIDGGRTEKTEHKKPVLWRQRFTDGLLPFEHCEVATDSYRLAVRPVDIAPDEPMVLKGNTAPKIAGIWPKASTLPNEIRFTADSVSVVGALAKVQDALSWQKGRKNAMGRSATAEFETGDTRSGYETTVLTISSHNAVVRTTLIGVTMTGSPIAFNLTYLSQALDNQYGSTVRFDNATRPALIASHENAPSGAIISILMPVTR